ncbi:MAG: ankyrin repeat domain-containing protein [Phycisphaerales bacterium JB038]
MSNRPRRLCLGLASLSLLLGACSTVAIAWACAAEARFNSHQEDRMSGFVTPEVAFRLEERRGWRRLNTYRRWSAVIEHADERLPAWSIARERVAGEMVITEVAAGFPFLALYAREGHDNREARFRAQWSEDERDSRYLGELRIGRPPPVHLAAYQVLPCLPLPLGFTLNTLLAAALWLPLLGAAPALAVRRRRWRRRRQRCGFCGYRLDPAVGPRCSECGRSAAAPLPACSCWWLAPGVVLLLVGALGVTTKVLERRAHVPRLPPLHQAADAGDLGRVRELLAAGVDPNARLLFDDGGFGGMTALAIAAQRDHPSVVRTLLARGADPNLSQLWTLTPLRLAISAGARGATHALLRSEGIRVNPERRREEGPLGKVLALWGDDVETVQLLLEAGLEVNPQAPHLAQPLSIAARQGCLQTARLLLQTGADPNRPGGMRLPLVYAVDRADLAMTSLLLAAGADVTAVDLAALTSFDRPRCCAPDRSDPPLLLLADAVARADPRPETAEP